MVSGLFLASSLVLITTPGPDSALVCQLVLGGKRWRPAAVAALGMISAGVLHAVLAMTGVSVLLSSRPALFTALQWCGAAVMCLWGVRALRAALRPAAALVEAGQEERRRGRRAAISAPHPFALGFLCTGSNPKVGLFLLAYLPQFVPVGAPQTRSMALLAAVHLSMAALWLTLLITVMHVTRARLAARRAVPAPGGQGTSTYPSLPARLAEGAAGAVFIGFAIRLAVS